MFLHYQDKDKELKLMQASHAYWTDQQLFYIIASIEICQATYQIIL